MEFFATLDVQLVEDQQAIEQVMASRDKRWLASLGLKGGRNAQLMNECKEQPMEVEQVDANAEMAALEEEMVNLAMKTPAENERPVKLTMQLIRECLTITKHASRRTQSATMDDKEVDAMVRKKILRLDWLDIGRIENLDAFTHLKELYLQYNLIETISNLEHHINLTYLALAGNRIRKVENLTHLHKLEFLDLSMNYITDFHVSEFPTSLRILRLAGNPFVKHMPAYAHLFFERLPNIMQVDQYRRPLSHSLTKVHPIDESSMNAAKSPLVFSSANNQKSDLLGEQEVATPIFNLTDYEKQHNDRIAKWKLQLTTLTSRTRDQLNDNVELNKASCSSRFHGKRSFRLPRAPSVAIDTPVSHTFKQVSTLKEL
ncbi:hypothetical protein CCR75_007246 [Bremia lactucae]|uniref:Uncharacterized protein n=1 Tax=Bremia lactucae TaxID=4779 RepID=A0A976NZM5_BRELC|nr:hypothetical protein CCR75_007246 [Bremia lactucae]